MPFLREKTAGSIRVQMALVPKPLCRRRYLGLRRLQSLLLFDPWLSFVLAFSSCYWHSIFYFSSWDSIPFMSAPPSLRNLNSTLLSRIKPIICRLSVHTKAAICTMSVFSFCSLLSFAFDAKSLSRTIFFIRLLRPALVKLLPSLNAIIALSSILLKLSKF